MRPREDRTTPLPLPDVATLRRLAPAAVGLARDWASAAGAASGGAAARDPSARLGALLADRAGLDLAVAFVDRVARPEDPRVAARELAALPAAATAGFLSPLDRVLLALGRVAAPVAPGVVVPAARARLRRLVGHLVVDSADRKLTAHLARAREAGYRLNLNLLGEAVLGEREAASRVARTVDLLRRPDVDYVSIKLSSLVSQVSTWDTPGTVARAVERLRPLYREALANGAFVNLDMEEYRDLAPTLDAFLALVGEPELARLEAGVVLQAYLPDAPAAFERVVEAATRRVDAGGAPVKVRLVKGANLAMELVEADLHGWPQAPHPSKAETDATYVRILDRALTPEVARAVRIGVAGHNLHHLALAHLLARERGVADAMDVEMLQGMAPAASRAVRDTVGSVLLYTPVVARDDFDLAVSYLVRRLEENAGPENYLHQSLSAEGRAEAERRFLASIEDAATVTTTPRRRAAAGSVTGAVAGSTAGLGAGSVAGAFAYAPDADPTVEAVRETARTALASPPDLTVDTPELTSIAAVDALVGRARAVAGAWGATSGAERAAVLVDVADRLEADRFRLVALMAHEAGKTVGEADPEVSEAVDFARYYARGAALLDREAAERGRVLVPRPVTLVTPPWNFPVAIAAGGVLAALAAGSAVVMKPSPNAARCGEEVAGAVRAALAAAGFDPDLVQVARVPEDEVGRHLVAHDGVDQVVLTGALATARLFAGWRVVRPGGPRVLAETSGKNAIVVTPSADLDLAVADVTRSAFGHAGQKCSAASLVVLVGSVGTSRRFHDQLLDSVASLRVGVPDDLGTGMGPVIEPPSGKLRRALTTLDPGESWALVPRELTAEEIVEEWGPGAASWAGRLWTPGIRSGVRPGSWFHRTECFGPVLGVMRAATLDEAIEWQNAVAFGLTGGLHSLDEDEIARWTDRVEVGNAYVNRGITGAIVQRQPFGGWKGSVMGPGAKAGGPAYVAQLGDWRPARVTGAGASRVSGASEAATRDGEVAGERVEALAREALAVEALAAAMLAGEDVTGLPAEENTLRLRPVPRLLVRLAETGAPGDLGLTVRCARALGVPEVTVSLAAGRAEAGAAVLPGGVGVVVEDETALAERLAGLGDVRVRWLGAPGEPAPTGLWEAALAVPVGSGATIIDDPAIGGPAAELRRVAREQAISRTRHRYGHLHG
ncbi:MAG: aldehyde dehydrogenase [Micrococcales bacterium 73-15]|uniref:bifunctional proline dehydrogenase/L-glutamate gamma-semialdehyde dehydrogenase n=1 Tax=Salana multivorans TaxID=120377 RepID=UPI00095CFCA1|nr:bifunctional proline dehydrogenase/L-glutamate gamma-semialdehyde dehydrogenase [Salana multivorans]OJX97920.1 MAG: aldehyde dehydrogenase [Micrococcales bacterium 73-15]